MPMRIQIHGNNRIDYDLAQHDCKLNEHKRKIKMNSIVFSYSNVCRKHLFILLHRYLFTEKEEKYLFHMYCRFTSSFCLFFSSRFPCFLHAIIDFTQRTTFISFQHEFQSIDINIYLYTILYYCSCYFPKKKYIWEKKKPKTKSINHLKTWSRTNSKTQQQKEEIYCTV